MASADNDTFEGALVTLITQIGKMKMLPDADLRFVVGLETMVLEKARSPERKLQAMGLLPGGGQAPGGAPPPDMGMGAPPDMGMGMPPPGGPPPDMGMGGMSAPPPSMLGAGAPPGVQQSPNMPPEEVMPMMA